jgi:5-methylcytosine-specific restriction endonuclease McrA
MPLINDEYTKDCIDELVYMANKYPLIDKTNYFKTKNEYYKKKRAYIYKIIADEDKLCFCGSEADAIHHIRPMIRGGSNQLENLIFICVECHALVHEWLKQRRDEAIMKAKRR